MSAAAKKEIARQFFEEIWGNQNMELADELLDPDFVFALPFVTVKGRDTFKKLVHGSHAAWQDLTYTVFDIVAEEEKVAVYWHSKGTQVNTWNGIEPTGKSMSIDGMTFFDFSNGKMTQAIAQNNFAQLLYQLDLIELPGTVKFND